MVRYEYKITAEVDQHEYWGWIVRVWMRERSAEGYSAWRCVITRDYRGSFRDEVRPRAAFQGIARCLSKLPGMGRARTDTSARALCLAPIFNLQGLALFDKWLYNQFYRRPR